MCHLWADSEKELLDMVGKISVNPKWIQGHETLSFGKHKNASWVHFDISKGKRALALKQGAIACDKYAPLEHCARLDIASGDSFLVAYGRRRLSLVDHARGISRMRFSARYRRQS